MSSNATSNSDLKVLIEQATTNNTLPPMLVQKGTYAVATWAHMSSKHIVALSWKAPEGPDQGPLTESGSDTGEARIYIPPEVIGVFIGQTVTIHCEVTLNDQVVATATLDLQVENIPLAEMPAPKVLDLWLENGVNWMDLRKFSGNARVSLGAFPFIAPGQRLFWYAVGQEHTSPFRFQRILDDHVITPEEADAGYEFLEQIFRDWLNANDDYSSCTQEYGVIYSGADPLPPVDPNVSLLPENAHEGSRTTYNLRLGDPELVLNAPDVPKAKNNTLDPADVPQGATVCATVEGMLETDTICFFLKGTPGDGSADLGCINGSASGTVCRPLPRSAIIANIDTHVTLNYTYTRDSVTLPSPDLDLKILPLKLPKPEFVEAINGYFEPSAADCGATVCVQIWALASVGQAIWAWVVNTEDGITSWLSNGTLLTQEQLDQDFIEWLVDPNFLTQLSVDQRVEIKVSVNFDGLVNQPSSLQFPTAEVLIRQTYAVSDTVKTDGHAFEVGWSNDSKWLYAGQLDGFGLAIFNAETLALETTLPTGYTRMITVDPPGKNIFASGLSGLWHIDGSTHTLVGKIIDDQTYGCAFTPDGKYLYVTNYEGNKVYKLETSTYTIVKILTGFNRSREIVIASIGDLAYVANLGAGTVEVIDTTTDLIVHTITGFVHPNGIDLSKDNKTLCISDYDSPVLSIYNAQNFELEGTVSCFDGLYTVKIHPTKPLAFASDYAKGHIVIIDLQLKRVISKVKGLTFCQGISPSRDGTRLAVAERRRVSIIQL